ncbi:PepSY-associated TM helix domain-containing protein [Leptolyngbyaceae cyanobacterium UHCC 1019]
MKTLKWRNVAFHLHRWLGLAIGLLLILIGITGSLLIFEEEISDWLNTQQFGVIIPQAERLAPATVLDTAKAAHPNWQAINLYIPSDDHHPYKLRMTAPDANPDLYLHGDHEVFVHPYTGVVLGDRAERYSFYRFLLNLHYRLFAENIGIKIVGIAGLLLFILCISGLVLWTGWRKLINGFKIKWKAHPKRVSFDIHKVAGIVAVIFLTLTAITGVGWNFYEFTQPAIYALTATPTLPNPESKPIAGKSPVGLTEVLVKADTALPDSKTTIISLPDEPKAAFSIYKQIPGGSTYGGAVYIDQFNGQVLRVDDERRAALGDLILNAFIPLHFGTFWGLPSRILYVFVGLSPLMLFVTGVIMWWFRRKQKGKAAIAYPTR